MENSEFYRYATRHMGMNGNALNDYMRFTSKAALPVVDQ